MSSPRERLSRLPALDVAQALRELADRAGSAPLPWVTLLLDGGHGVVGEVLKLDRGTVLLHLTQSQGALDVAHVPVSHVRGLFVHHREETLPALAQGAMPAWTGPPPGKLELERQFGALTDELAAALGHPVRGSLPMQDFVRDEARVLLGSALKGLAEALRQVLADPLGKQALGRVEALGVVAGASGWDLMLAGDRLQLTLGKEGQAPDARRLHEALEAAL